MRVSFVNKLSLITPVIAVLAVVGVIALNTRPAHAVTVANCAGATDFPVIKSWDFNEPAGSTVARETIQGLAADNLSQPPGYTGVVFTGGTVQFNNHQLLTGAYPNATFNPGTRDFSYCVMWRWVYNSAGTAPADPDGYNLSQFGDNPATGDNKGFIKMMPGYGRVDNVGGAYVQLLTHGSSHLVWHTEVITKRGSTITTYLDGTLDETGTLPIGNVDLSKQPISVGGKYWRPGQPPVDSNDLGMFVVALVRIGEK